MRNLRTVLLALTIGLLVSGNTLPGFAGARNPNHPAHEEAPHGPIYLPLVVKPDRITARIHAPFFDGKIAAAQTAVVWFGRVNLVENYADVSFAYNAQELYARVQIFDRYLWYDRNPTPENLTAWDATSLYLDLDGSQGDSLTAKTYRFDGQLVWWEERDNHQAAFQGSATGWQLSSIPFITESNWKGNAPNDMNGDRGWRIIFRIPFSSLGLSGAPSAGTVWGLGVTVHDRDDVEGTPRAPKTWPQDLDPARSATWSRLSFGLPTHTPPQANPGGTVTIRHKLNGAQVVDAMVGGSSVCGSKFDFWTEWGDGNYPGSDFLNVQNQSDISDWPCFSKFFLTMPLNSLPAGKAILSAKLTLHQMGNAGGGKWGPSPDSLIQVFTVAQDWDEATLTWNNAPPPLENVSQAWVKPIAEWPGWPGVPWTWDLTRAVAEAYAAGKPLRLAFYSTDTDYNSGKYFVSSDTGDWNAAGRPTLEVLWGEP